MGFFNTRPRLDDKQVKQLSGDTITLSGVTNIDGTFRYKPGAVTGNFLKASDPQGTLEWAPISAVTWSISACTSPLYVTTIEACPNPTDPLYITAGNVQFGSSPSLIADIANTRLGIGTGISPSERLHVNGGDMLVETSNGKFFTDLDLSNGATINLSGGTSSLTRLTVSGPLNGGITIGHRGSTEGSFPVYGKQGDGFVYSSIDQNGLNIVSQPGSGTEDYIRFFVGQASGAAGTPDLHIQGSGTTKGNVGINTGSPTEKLHVEGSVRIVDGTEQNGYVLTCDTNGVGSWSASAGGGATIDPYQNEGNVNSITWDVSGTSTNYEAILTGNTTLNLTNVRNGDYGTLIVTQDGVGSHTLTFGAGAHRVVNGGGGTPTLTSTAGATDILSFTYNGTRFYWTVGNDYT